MEQIRVVNRLQADLQGVCPGLQEITGDVDNLWFLRFLTCRNDLTQLSRLQRASLLKIPDGSAQASARELLFRIANVEAIEQVCQHATEHGFGWLEEGESLQLQVGMVG